MSKGKVTINKAVLALPEAAFKKWFAKALPGRNWEDYYPKKKPTK